MILVNLVALEMQVRSKPGQSAAYIAATRDRDEYEILLAA